MNPGKVELSGANTAKLPLLSSKQKQDLFEQLQAGNLNARKELIEGNLRLVLSVIRRFLNTNHSPDDLFQIGCIGLIKAIDHFDCDLGVQFSTYAVPMIMGECRRYLRDSSQIRVSRSLRDIAYKAIYTKEYLMQHQDTEPTLSEIADACDLPEQDILSALDAIASPLSLYDPVYQDEGDNLYLMDQIRDKSCTEENWVNDLALQEAITHLTKREHDIIRLRFFEGRTQTEVAKEIAISQAQVSRLEKGALASMKKYLQ